ncbi:type II toxin-antitoxin system RelE/ParE family toxin [Argonema galeatum]|uniref:type II toxin-antitoxin system RelE/ParE family toxin n=1 Tax=Argonema galeatum TaxID=2942762 RepID=UPI002013A9A4|nr:type II toxin-antitoxin system RelE/ParE family toxin [Argonema galeatum]MCL1464565.1 type II toxin-antitoxin system RelE/ParE family toxin [Argonema galeatum A003/A1]
MKNYYVSPQAASEIEEINDYIASKDPAAADRFLRALTQKFETLVNFPNMGRRWDKLSPPLRSFPIDNYLIFYHSIEDGIEVVRVVSGYRDLENLFSGESNS